MAGQHWDNLALLESLRSRTPGKETTLEVLQRIYTAAIEKLDSQDEADPWAPSLEELIGRELIKELDKYGCLS